MKALYRKPKPYRLDIKSSRARDELIPPLAPSRSIKLLGRPQLISCELNLKIWNFSFRLGSFLTSSHSSVPVRVSLSCAVSGPFLIRPI